MSNSPTHADPIRPVVDAIYKHLPKFDELRPDLEAYATALESHLEELIDGDDISISSRVKSLESFGKKIGDKFEKYQKACGPDFDPIGVMTDLIGIRIVTPTLRDLEVVCGIIRKNFEIDHANSRDATAEMKTTEFGYQSIHYVVYPQRIESAGGTDKEADARRNVVRRRIRIEIQVRTLLQHVWADRHHRLEYKSAGAAPGHIRRRFHALSAVLETIDRNLNQLVEDYRQFESSQGVHRMPDAARSELAVMEAILATDQANEGLLIRWAQVQRSLGEHAKIVERIGTMGGISGPLRHALGRAQCELNIGNPKGPGFGEGLKNLQASAEDSEATAEMKGSRAEFEGHVHGADSEMLSKMHLNAVTADHTDPTAFSRQLVYELERSATRGTIAVARVGASYAAQRCRMQIAAGINVPDGLRSLVILSLVLGKDDEAILAMTRLLAMGGWTSGADPGSVEMSVQYLADSFGRLATNAQNLSGLDDCRLLLLIVKAVRNDDHAMAELGKRARPDRRKPQAPVILLAGACDPQWDGAVDRFRDVFLKAVDGDSFHVISGGTDAGVCRVAKEASDKSNGRIQYVGYAVGSHGSGQVLYVPTTSRPGDFSVRQPLQAWVDLIVDGMDPRSVRLVAYCGGKITDQEIAIALLLGASVAVIDDRSLPAERRFQHPEWNESKRLHRLPLDFGTLHAYLRLDGAADRMSEETRTQYEQAAIHVHDEYLKSVKPKDASRRPWEELPKDLKTSCYDQVLYFKDRLLAVAGLKVVKTKDDSEVPLFDMKSLPKEVLDTLAEMEHGRWNAERLLKGWRLGPDKDVEKKISPFLVSWKDLPDGVKEWDYKMIYNLPEVFQKVGMRIVKV